jgi:hypothetical protein
MLEVARAYDEMDDAVGELAEVVREEDRASGQAARPRTRARRSA